MTNCYRLEPDSLPVIIRSYKSICSREISKEIGNSFRWQTRFYDHIIRIIRNEKGLFEIRKYIRQNPQKWDLDRNNPKNF